MTTPPTTNSVEEIDTYTNDGSVICPHCGHEKNPDAEDLSWVEDGEAHHHCNKCNKEFYSIVTYIRFSRESRKA